MKTIFYDEYELYIRIVSMICSERSVSLKMEIYSIEYHSNSFHSIT